MKIATKRTNNILMFFKAQIAGTILQLGIDAINLKPGTVPININFNEADIMNISFSDMEAFKTPTSTQQSVPSWIVFGVFFIIFPISSTYINERRQNTLMRLHTMNVPLRLQFPGKIIPFVTINLFQVLVMILVGMYIVPLFGAPELTIGGSIGGLLAVSLALSFSAICLGILLAVSVNSSEQAATVGGLTNILLGAIGGIMVPRFVMPSFMKNLSRISPMSWGLEGYLDIFLRQGNIKDVIDEVTALTLFGLVFLLSATIIFTNKRRGMG